MNIFLVLLLLFLNLSLGSLAIFRNYRDKKNLIFFLLTCFTSLWILSQYLSDSNSYIAAKFWTQMTFFSSTWVLYSFFVFSNLFPKIGFGFSKYRLINCIFLFITISISSLSFTNLFVKDITFANEGTNTILGPLIILNLLYVLIVPVFSVVILIKKYKRSIGIEKQQLTYVLLGLFFSVFFAVIFSVILPLLFTHNSSTSKFAPLATLLLVGFATYAIIKHRLLDIRIIVLRTITYSLSVVFVSAFVVFIGILLPNLINNLVLQSIIAVFISIFIVIILNPLKRLIGRATDKIFFKATIDYKLFAKNLVDIVNKEIDLEALIREIDHQLITTLKLENSRIILPNTSGVTYLPLHRAEHHYYLDSTSNLVTYLKKDKRIVVLDALERRIEDTKEAIEREELEKSKVDIDKMNAAVVAPIVTDNRLAAILILGNKKSGDNFNQEDINLLELLGPQLASAIEKSRLYDQIRRFNIKLQKEIAISTEGLRKANEDLQDRNRFLTSLQAVTQLITRSLDFEKVTQAIVDSISTQMGFIGGVLLFYGEDRHKLFPEAITRVKYTEPINKLLPKPIREYHIDVRKEDTKLVKAVLTGEIQKGEHFSEFISPPVPTVVAVGIQQLVHGHAFLAVPIRSENEVVGCIVYLLEESLDEVNQNDINMMNSLADQTGIIYRNLELVQKLRRTNDELGEANEHLKQLDQAKSEFVSIASHQLRTPMTGIMGYLSMITTGDFGKVPKQLNGILGQLLNASQKMIQLINLFLDVSKIESGKLILSRGPHKIEEIIERSIQVIGKIASDKGLKLEFIHPAKPLPTLQIDDKIFDVVSNLIDNAI